MPSPSIPTRCSASRWVTARLTFSGGNNGTFAYTVNGIADQVDHAAGVRPVADVHVGELANLALATNYQDLWWAVGGAESGWGINFAHQGDAIFATWFTYDFSGAALPLSATLTKVGPGIYSGSLIKTSGPAFSAVPFNPNAVIRTVVGTATVTFSNGNAATFSYQVSLGSQTVNHTKAIERKCSGRPAPCASSLSAATQSADSAGFIPQAPAGVRRLSLTRSAALRRRFAPPPRGC